MKVKRGASKFGSIGKRHAWDLTKHNANKKRACKYLCMFVLSSFIKRWTTVGVGSKLCGRPFDDVNLKRYRYVFAVSMTLNDYSKAICLSILLFESKGFPTPSTISLAIFSKDKHKSEANG